MTWREFLKEKMGPCMRSGKDHGTCMREIGEEWRSSNPSTKARPFANKKKDNKLIEFIGAGTISFIGAGYIGNYLEKKYKSGITSSSRTKDKATAWVINNGPKFISLATITSNNPIIRSVGCGIGTSLVVDTILRYTNNWAPTDKTVIGFRILSEKSENNKWTPLTEEQLQEIEKRLNN